MDLDKSQVLSSISEREGTTKKDLLEEMGRRKDVLHWMRERNIRSYKNVAAIIAEYYALPKQTYEKVLAGEEVGAVAVSREA
jgi:flagellar protein FlaI